MSSGVTTWALSPHTDLLEFVQSFPFPRTKGMLVLNENQLALSSRSEIAILDVKKGDALEKAATEFKAIEDVAQKDGFVYVAHELGTKVSVYNLLKDKDDIEDHQVPSPASNISQAQLCEEDPLYLCTLDSVGKKLSICHVTNGSNVSVSCDCSRLFQWTKLNRLITLCEDSNHICIWSFDGQQDLRKAFVHDGHKSHVKHVAQHSVIENMFLSADGRENFHLWLYNEKYGSISE